MKLQKLPVKIAELFKNVKLKIVNFLRLTSKSTVKIFHRLRGAFLKLKKVIPTPRFNSVKFEISVIYTLILGIILVSFSSIFYVITSRTLYQELDNELRIKALGVTTNINSYLEVKGEEPKTLQYAVEQTIARENTTLRRWWYIGFERSWFKKLDEQDLSQDFINFLPLDKSFHIKSKNLQDIILDSFLDNVLLTQGKETFWNLDVDNKEIRIINYPFPNNGTPTHIIQIGISKGPVIHILNEWLFSVLICIPIILILTGFIGVLLASRILTPLGRIITTAKEISYENLNLRVKPEYYYQEMNQLIETFNDMIIRLETSFKHIDEFSTHVSHELKTPLTIIRGEAELSYYAAKLPENKESLKVIIDEIDKVLATIESLLFLGKTRYQPDSFNFQDIDLGQFLQEIAEQFQYVVAGKNIKFKFDKILSTIIIRADKLHLRRLFFNLMENAVKFTPKGGNISLSVFTIKNTVHISIFNSGEGISEKNISKIFDQFFREENKESGIGLGLSIAQSIAKVHKGTITVQSQLGKGTTFTVILPYSKKLKPTLTH